MNTRIRLEIEKLAKANPSEEICGLIYADISGNVLIYECENIAEDKTKEFHEDYLKVFTLSSQLILGVYHSHPISSGFSEADLESAEETCLPFYLYDIHGDKWHEYIPSTYESSIDCLRFALGFQDCYGLVRNFFRKKYNHYLSDYDRDETFCHEEQEIIMKSFEKEGFYKVEFSDIQIDDVILFKSEKALPQHFGILIEPQTMLHHPRNALSRKEAITGRWISRIVCVLRRKKQLI
jgi:proteasome lid subunit RPN8/RPN11